MQTLTARYRVTTPLFMGAPAGADGVELNLRGVKGAVRFWWRALNYARLTNGGKNLRTLHEAEGRLFGAAAEKNRDWGGSRYKWRVDWEGREPKVYNAGPNSVLPGAGSKPGTIYLGGQGLLEVERNLFEQLPNGGRGKLIRRIPSGELRRPCYWGSTPMVLAVSIIAPSTQARDLADDWPALRDALWVFGLLGGIGSRTSRGFGSLSMETLVGDEVAVPGPANIEEYSRRLHALMIDYQVAAATELAEFSALSAMSRIWLLDTAARENAGNEALSLLNTIGRQMIRYRSFGRRGDDGVRRTTLREIAEKNFRDGHDWAKKPTSVPAEHAFDRRIAFGMPLGYTGCDVTWVKPQGHERRGSPLIFHVQHLTNGDHIAVATMLPARLVPPNQSLQLVLRRGAEGRVAAADRVAAFEQQEAWETLTRLIEGTRTTQQPYFAGQQLLWPELVAAA